MHERTLPILKADMKHVVGVSHRNINKIKADTGNEVDIDLRGQVLKYEGKVFQMVNLRSASEERLTQAMLAIAASSHRHRSMAPPVVGTSVHQILPAPLRSPPPRFERFEESKSPRYAPSSPVFTYDDSEVTRHQAILFSPPSPPYQPRMDNEQEDDELVDFHNNEQEVDSDTKTQG